MIAARWSPTPRGKTAILLVLMLSCVGALGGCAGVREYNRRASEARLRRAVEDVPLQTDIRLELSTGDVLEGPLLSCDWPKLEVGGEDASHVLDGREIVAAWRVAFGHSQESLMLAGLLALSFGTVGYAIGGLPPCWTGCDDSERSNGEAAVVTVVAAAVGADSMGFDDCSASSVRKLEAAL